MSRIRRELRSAHDVFGVHSNPRNTFGCFIYFRPDTPSTISKQREHLSRHDQSAPPYNASKRDANHTNNTEYHYSAKSEEMRVFCQFATPGTQSKTAKQNASFTLLSHRDTGVASAHKPKILTTHSPKFAAYADKYQ
jgi:hypothetical protein